MHWGCEKLLGELNEPIDHVVTWPVIEATPLPRPSGRQARRRFAKVVRAARHLPGPALAAATRRPDASLALAVGLRKGFDELGGTYLKFGQLLGSAPSLFGERMASEFRGCLDEGPPIPFAEVRRAVEAELGRPLEDAFAAFEELPIAAASIAAVHRARLHDGRTVAVKVLRPGIEDVVAADLAVMRPLFEWVGRVVAVGIAGTLPGLLDGLEEQIEEELDLRNEARAVAWFQEALDTMDLPLVRVPRVVTELSGRRILTMSFLEGRPVDKLLDPANPPAHLRPSLIEALQAWFAVTLTTGVFHGDIHAGNLLLLDDGTIGVVDWGVVGRLDAETRRFFRALVAGSLGDESAWPVVREHLLAVYGDGVQQALGLDDDEILTFLRGQIEPILTTPFADLDLRQMLVGGNAPTPTPAEAPEAARRGAGLTRLRAQYRFWREQRTIQAQLRSSPGKGSSFDRGTFLLSKQLVYLERYGKLYLPDVPLIFDVPAFEAMLAAAPA